MTPIHVHFGLGDLGIGAVIPVLSDQRRIVFIQVVRSSGFDWRAVVQNDSIDLSRQVRPEGDGYPRASANLPCVSVSGNTPVVMSEVLDRCQPCCILLVDDWDSVQPLLEEACSVSCSIRGGQRRLAQLLLRNDTTGTTKRPVLAFENTPHDDLKDVCEKRVRGWRLVPVITDRICGRRIADTDFGRVQVPCERFLRMITADEPQVRDVFFNQLLTTEQRGNVDTPIRLVEQESLEFHRIRKRWIVNSLHEVLALLSASTLRSTGLPLEDQYLPQTIEWSMNHDGVLQYAVELFIRLQAMRMACESQRHSSAVQEFYGATSEQFLYDTYVAEARHTFDRMREFADHVGRLFDADELKNEWKKYDEHVRQAIRYVETNERWFRDTCIFGRPDVDEVWELREYLQQAIGRLSVE